MHDKLHRDYFTPGTRGYVFIERFYRRNQGDLAKLDYGDFDAFLNQVFLGLTSVSWNKIEGPEEHYVIKSIYYQCWNLLFQQKHHAGRHGFGSVSADEDADYVPLSTEPDPQEMAEQNDLFEKIVLFKATLKPDDIKILNALIDDRKLTELGKELGITYNNLNVRIKRLRERLAKYLNEMGFHSATIKHFLKSESV